MSNEPKTVTEAYDGFLETADLEGRDITVTIDSVRAAGTKDKGTDGKTLKSPIVKFTGAKKEWVMCKTNARTIRTMYGNNFDEWKGKKITIYPTTCNAFGNPKTPCIRVRVSNSYQSA